MSLSQDEIEFQIAYETIRLKGDASTRKDEVSVERGSIFRTSLTKFQAYIPPRMAKDSLRLIA